MTLGVLTENGISMNVSPLFEENNLALSNLRKKGQQNNEKITALIDLTNRLRKYDTLSKAANTA